MSTDPADAFRAILNDKVREHAAAVAQYTDLRLRAALIAEGIDPEALARVLRRYRAGEFDPPMPQVVIQDDTQ